MYTIRTAAKILEIDPKRIRAIIRAGWVCPARSSCGYVLTDDDLDLIEDQIMGKQIRGQKDLSKWLWVLKLRPEIALTWDRAVRDDYVLEQNWWAAFLNGEWVRDKPKVPGVYLVMACDQIAGQYRHFKTLAEIEQWQGWFWSVELPIPMREVSCTSE